MRPSSSYFFNGSTIPAQPSQLAIQLMLMELKKYNVERRESQQRKKKEKKEKQENAK